MLASLAALAALLFQDAPIVTMRVPYGGIQPQLVQSGSTLDLVYYTGDSSHGNLFYVQSKDEGQTWSNPISVNHQKDDAIAIGAIRGAQIAVGRDGRVYVVWLGSKPGDKGMPLYFTRQSSDRKGFEPERDLQGGTLEMDGGASVAADNEGDVYVAWHAMEKKGDTEAERKVWIAKSTDDGQTFGPEKPAWDKPTGACGCCSLKAYCGRSGRLYIAYRSATAKVHRDPYLLTSIDKGEHFGGQKIGSWEIGACPMSSFSIVEVDGRFPAVGFEQEGNCVTWGIHSEVMVPVSKYPILIASGSKVLLCGSTSVDFGQQAYNTNWMTSVNGKIAGGNGDPPPLWSFPAAFTRSDGKFVILY